MNKKLIFILFLAFAGMSYGQESWKKERIKLPPTVCYASPKSYHTYVHPSQRYLEMLKSGSLKKATIEVTYVGFPVAAQKAFQYAVDIWQNLIYSPVPIHIQASWTSLNKGVLGSTSATNFYKNFGTTQLFDCYYPVALVEKMLGKEVNSVGDFEIETSFNKDFSNWYFGTDGQTPLKQYDFASVVLHELAHGLGFSGFFYTNRGRGGYGSDDNLSASFDQFVLNKNGQKLINTKLFSNPSVSLYQNLTSGELYFENLAVENTLPQLYAPATWDEGSSIYHLDDTTYPEGDPNSLMTPFTGMGEAIHDPGPYTLAILDDLGWKNITISHKPLKDVENISAPIAFNAEIVSDYALDSTKIFLVYSTNKFVKTDSVLLKATNVPASFSAVISKFQDGEFDYFFSASDIKNRRFVFPSGAPSQYLTFKVGIDHEPPVVTHEPVKYMLSTDLSTKIKAKVTDNIGVKSVNLEYFVNGGIIKEMSLQKDSGDYYTGNLNFQSLSLKGGDSISYRISAVDSSSQRNIGKSPLTGYYTFYIGGIQKPVNKYVNDFNTVTHDFISPDFNVLTVSGFDSPALNTAHPYLSPDADSTNYNFTTVLKYPIILKSGGKMSFDEIVLVEPGDAGTKFGDPNFYDYVIVEGSRDGGANWKPLVDGYDSNAKASWLNLYNSSTSGQNSTAVPTKDLFVKREVDLLFNGNFKANDTILVRFRLFSDPYAHGWGWIIDNLSIQDVGTAVNPALLSSGEISLFPNPATSKVNLQIQAKNTIHQLQLKVYNSLGKMVIIQSYPVESNRFETVVDVSNLIPGLYLFAIEPENGQVITRKILVNF